MGCLLVVQFSTILGSWEGPGGVPARSTNLVLDWDPWAGVRKGCLLEDR